MLIGCASTWLGSSSRGRTSITTAGEHRAGSRRASVVALARVEYPGPTYLTPPTDWPMLGDRLVSHIPESRCMSRFSAELLAGRRRCLPMVIGVLTVLVPWIRPALGQPRAITSRSFYMGMTDWSYGPSLREYDQTLALVYEHGDLISFQFDDGVPWPEAYAGSAYHPRLERQIAERLDSIPEGHRVCLEFCALTNSRRNLAGYFGDGNHMPRPAPWNGYAIDDPRMITAYANFCNDLIRRFRPTFVTYSIECTDYMLANPQQVAPFATFHRGVFNRIKARHPEVRLGISVSLRHPDTQAAQKLPQLTVPLQPAFDYLAASVYPYILFAHDDAGDPDKLPQGWFQQLVDAARGKPIAISETGWVAADIRTLELDIHGTPERQREYVAQVLRLLHEHEGLFVVWWTVADYDRLWRVMPPASQELARIWRDTGLFDERLAPRPSLDVWDWWLEKPRR